MHNEVSSHNEVGGSIPAREDDVAESTLHIRSLSLSTAAVHWTFEKRCHGCPKLSDEGFTTVRWRRGWRDGPGRRSMAETLVVCNVKVFRPRDPTWKQIVRKLKRFVGMKYDGKSDGSFKGSGNVSTAAVWPLRLTQPCGISAPKVSIRQRRNAGAIPALDVPKVRSFITKTYEF